MFSIIFGIVMVVFVPINYYIGKRGWNTLGRHVPYLNKRLYWAVYWLLVCTFPAGEMGEEVLPPGIMKIFTYSGGYWIVAMLYFFLILLIIDLVRLSDKKFDYVPALVKDSPRTPVIVGIAVLTTVVSVIAYGAWNAGHPIVNRYDISLDKKSPGLENLHIVMISDLHVGNIVRPERLDDLTDTVNGLTPDLILFAGDITDQSIEPGEAEDMVAAFSRMNARYGKFAVPGNHDHFGGQVNNIGSYLRQAGITLLRDNYEKVAGSFYVIGRDNAGHFRGSAEEATRNGSSGRAGRKGLAELTKGLDPSLPLILLDHQPVDIEDAQKNKIDLQLSGHTHDGQFFPINFVTGQIFEQDWGLLKRGAYNLIVSCGYGTWGPPVRIGNNPEIVDINAHLE